MEKINKDKTKVKQKQNNKNNYDHRRRKIMSIDKINSRFMEFMKKEKKLKNDKTIKNIKLNNINKSNVKAGEKTEITKHKKIAFKRTSSMIEKKYYENELGKYKLKNSKKDINNKDNIKVKLVDYNIIINSNKTNYNNKGNDISNESTFSKKKKQLNNIKNYSTGNYKEKSHNIILTKSERKPNENKKDYNKIEATNFTQNKKYSNNKNIKLNNKTISSKNNLEFNISEIKESHPKKTKTLKEKQNKTSKNIQNRKHYQEDREKSFQIENRINTNDNAKEKRKKEQDKVVKNNSLKSINYSNNKNEQTNLEKQISPIKKKSKPSNTLDKKEFTTKIKSNLSQYIHINNLLETFPGGFNYLKNKLIYLEVSGTEEEFKFIYTQKNFYKSPNVKELFRKGIPLKYIRIFIQKLLNLENWEENYKFKYSMIFKNLDTDYIGDYVPYYYGKKKKKLKDILTIHYLNEEGIKQLKIIMWLISDLVPKIEYSPFLVKICSILLIIFEKEEAYAAMETLIEMNYDISDIYKLRWHFRYSFAENKKLVKSIKNFLENESDNIKELFVILRNKGLEPLLLINDLVESLFLDFLNFYGILRFICIFLYEGVKALYRISYGILNYIYEKNLEEIKNCKNDLMSELKRIIFNTFDYNKIFEDAFNLQLSRFNNGYIKNDLGEDIEALEIPFECASKYNNGESSESESNIEKEKQLEKGKNPEQELEKEKEEQNIKNNNYISNFYLPSIEPKSNILTGKYIFKLWPKLPKKFRNTNLATIYSLSRKKVNMKSILELSSKYPKNLKILILIETEQEELFGIILPQMLEDSGDDNYIQLEKCYLINFLPKIKIYKEENEITCKQMLCCNKKGLWFCKESVGDLIFIDGTLSEGNTCKENTYFGKISLTQKGNFLIKDFEIIVFVENII